MESERERGSMMMRESRRSSALTRLALVDLQVVV